VFLVIERASEPRRSLLGRGADPSIVKPALIAFAGVLVGGFIGRVNFRRPELAVDEHPKFPAHRMHRDDGGCRSAAFRQRPTGASVDLDRSAPAARRLVAREHPAFAHGSKRTPK
jgi:hypothetical protein